jgi:ATP-binding cassette, subfamily B, bacterial
VLLYALQGEYLRVGQVGFGQTTALRRADYYRDLATGAMAAKEVRVWGLTQWLLGRFDTAWVGAMEPLWKARKPGRRVVWLSTFVVIVANVVSYAALAWAALRGDLALGALAVYTQATLAASSFRAFDDANMILSHAAVAVPRVLALDHMLADAPHATADVPPGAPREGIRFEHVTFRYPGHERPIFDDLNLDIPAGRSLAIVGVNGAGKTTLVKLLCGLYAPSAGVITVDGTDVGTFAPAHWRARVAAIFQDFAHYHASARENIGMGALAIAHDEARLRAAAERAGALDLVEALPHGWDTLLSREYADGADLSGGQWQRIALARALFAVIGGATVLILDEPTANLDVRAEAELYDRFLDITAGLTTILISHRFSTVRRADHIVVLEGGRVVEQGDHTALMAQNGRYAAMFRVQAERFVEGAV